MKTFKKPTARLMTRFDNELKELSAGDLNSFINKNPFFARNRQVKRPNTLSVA